ncbi:putative phenylacetaldoxime dehydratase family protein [Corynespora cassiicola Philippines]|uniref:Putative phenylacetaldoxime dehydratase family protein n=1 Tax=Corynespora cassiicola Philippines TaxID=1448308 RepID=A0A2T2N634_CORCC|nr:putative phenylacetaldoxime dehydratase family protein [Corynespora cassiicola Philippines]
MDNSARLYPLKRPNNHKPPIPRWKLNLPDDLSNIYTAYIGVQNHLASLASSASTRKAVLGIESWLKKEENLSSLISESFTVLDGDKVGSAVWVCYWTQGNDFKNGIQRLSLPALYASLAEGDRKSIGMWCERFTSAASRIETNYTGLDYLPGLGRIPGSSTSEHDFTAYWGAARDRIPDSAHELFGREDASVTAVPEVVPKGIGQHLVGSNYNNMVHIRSGQFWENCSTAEAQSYEEKLEPALENGLEYLWQNPAESGAIGVRYLRNTVDGDLNHESRPARKETCAAGFFRSLGDLEQWSKKHPSHLKIYRGALQHAKEFGPGRKFRTWHEVSVLKNSEAEFEYLNCRPDTGVIRFLRLRDLELQE